MSTATLPPDTRERILQTARELIQTRSYLGFSFQDIAERVGIRKASLYHHFPSKDALGAAVLGEATRLFESWAASRTGALERQLGSYFKMLRSTLAPGQQVCPTGAFVAGWGCMNDELQVAVRRMREVQTTWLESVLRQMPSVDAPRETAGFIFALVMGGMLSARATGQASDFDQAVAPARALLGLP